MKQKLFTLLTLLCFAVSGAWGTEETVTGIASNFSSYTSRAIVSTTPSGTTFVDKVYLVNNGSVSLIGSEPKGVKFGNGAAVFFLKERAKITFTFKSSGSASTTITGYDFIVSETTTTDGSTPEVYRAYTKMAGASKSSADWLSDNGTELCADGTTSFYTFFSTKIGMTTKEGKIKSESKVYNLFSSMSGDYASTCFSANSKNGTVSRTSAGEDSWSVTLDGGYYAFNMTTSNSIGLLSMTFESVEDTSAPVLKSTTPTDGATEVATDGNIVLTFDENVALASGYEFTLTDNEDNVIETWDAGGVNPAASVDNKTITLAYSGLANLTTYTLNINNANKITDTAATPNAMSSISLPSFTTVDGRTALTLTFTASETTLEAGGATQATSFSWTEDSGAGTKAYVSSDPTVATVSSEGVITPLKAGSTTITATGTPTDLVTYKPTSTTLDIEVKAVATKWDFTTVNNSYDLYNITTAAAAESGWAVNSSGYKSSTGFDAADPSANGKTLRALVDIRTTNPIRIDPTDKAGTYATAGRLQVDGNLTLKGLTKGQKITIFYASANKDNARKMTSDDLDNMSGFDAVKSGGLATGVGYVKANGDVEFSIVPGDGATGTVVNIAKITVENYEAISTASGKTYATYVTTNALDFASVSDGIKAYVAANTASAGSITFTGKDEVPAGTPLLIKTASAGATVYVPVIASADAVGTNYLVAGDGGNVTYDASASHFYYILTNGEFKQANNSPVAVGKAYLALPSAATSNELTINFDDEAGDVTGIATVSSKKQNNGEYYNLNGQRIDASHKGIVIVNGKKFFNK